jgi:flagellar biosynthetic protein FliR
MISVSVTDLPMLIAFWLVFTRLSAMIIQFPIFDEAGIPPMVKVLGCLVISFAFFPYVQSWVLKDIAAVGVDQFWVLTVFYALSGLILGQFVKSITQLFFASGSLITQQIGFGAISYFDPQAGSQVGPFEKIIVWTMLIVLLTSGALLPMFKGALVSFSTITYHSWGSVTGGLDYFLTFFKGMFVSSILLAAPAIFVNLLIMGVLGIIARTVPQMNVLMVSFVINIALGLLVFLSTSAEFFNLAFKSYTEYLGKWFAIVN